MLTHLNETKSKPSRVVILGSQGFVGGSTLQQLIKDEINAIGISKNEINLLAADAGEKLLEKLQPNDALVIVSALAPCKNIDMLMDNLRMMQTICKVVEKISLSHIVYISSEAVYADDVALATEESKVSPSSFHGMMHQCRELMIKQTANKTPLAILRPSLLYGKNDPHNGYGPNRFRRLAEKNESIVLFGNGEEKRDHIFIEDVAKIISLVVQHRSAGTLNIATGESHSFRDIAEEVVRNMNSSSAIQATERKNPITHRHFDISVCYKAFPMFRYREFVDGLKNMLNQNDTVETA
jgi:UDP-glucose 4-epimerase